MTVEVRLDCTRCHAFRVYRTESHSVVRCDECGKRHSKNSLHVVDPGASYDRDESGTLLEEPP